MLANHTREIGCESQIIDEDGEIAVKGPAVFDGYDDEDLTRAAFTGEWFRTGDLGRFDEDGYLIINGRSKNLLISSYGRNISPEWVESELMADPALADCVVFGDARPYCVALVSPRDPATSDASIQRVIDDSNARLPDYARVRQWHRLEQPLLLTGGLLTENGRPRRAAILAHFNAAIESLYATPATARIA